MASVDLSALDASLKHRNAKGTGLMVKKLTSGWGKVDSFQKLRVLDRIVLGSMSFKSLVQPGGKGTFNPTANIAKVQARIAEVKPAKVDILIGEPERLQLEATYFAEIEGTPGRDPEKFWLADHVHESVIEMAGVDTINGVWNGVLNPTGTTAVDVCNGILKLIDTDILTEELPDVLILTHSDLDFYLKEDNIIKEMKDMVKIYRTKLPAYAYAPATLYCAPERLSEYEFALETLNGQVNTYNSFNQPVLYFAKNIRIEPTLELAGTDFMAIIPDGNLLYLTDRDQGRTTLDSDYSKRDRSIAYVMDYWYGPNYYRADLIVVNDLRARPEEQGA